MRSTAPDRVGGLEVGHPEMYMYFDTHTLLVAIRVRGITCFGRLACDVAAQVRALLYCKVFNWHAFSYLDQNQVSNICGPICIKTHGADTVIGTELWFHVCWSSVHHWASAEVEDFGKHGQVLRGCTLLHGHCQTLEPP